MIAPLQLKWAGEASALARKCRDVELVGILPVDQILRP